MYTEAKQEALDSQQQLMAISNKQVQQTSVAEPTTIAPVQPEIVPTTPQTSPITTINYQNNN